MKKAKCNVSVIITNYNKKKYIVDTIKSVLSQGYKNFEIIVIDNLSTDNSYKLISKYKKIRLFRNIIKKTSALNQIKSIEIGLKKSRGKIICLLDGDDIFRKNKLRDIVEYFEKNPYSQAVCDIPLIKDKSQLNAFNYDNKRVNSNKIWPTTFPTSSISIKKKYLLDCIKKFQKEKFDFLEIDFRLCCVFSLYKKNYNVLNKNLTYYRQVNDGIMSSYKKFEKKWWIKRSQAFDFFFFIKKRFKKKYSYSFDYFLTKTISKIYNGLK